ncbi:MAG: hypothetical protein DMG64_19585 [Acidobacteria bacterium]|nr:MAG: hypothetical protein DMG64_19585 [Acidobacteriota bacterium]
MLPIWNEKAAFFMARYSRGGPHGQSRFPENEAKPKTGKDRKLWKIDRRTGAPFSASFRFWALAYHTTPSVRTGRPTGCRIFGDFRKGADDG